MARRQTDRGRVRWSDLCTTRAAQSDWEHVDTWNSFRLSPMIFKRVSLAKRPQRRCTGLRIQTRIHANVLLEDSWNNLPGCYLLDTWYLWLSGLESSPALNAPLVADIKTLLEGWDCVGFNNMRRQWIPIWHNSDEVFTMSSRDLYFSSLHLCPLVP